MSTFLHHRFVENLSDKCRLQNKPTILVAISGGQDSLCLMKLFLDIHDQFFSQIGFIHIDHQWRKDTVANAKHLVNLMSTVSNSSYFYQIQSNRYSEHKARETRYQILLDTANKHNYSFIATAHSSNDRIETFLQNLLRGVSANNLNSLVWNRALTNRKQLVRPLVNLQREEIAWFCRYYYLPFWSDNTNIFYGNSRNRVRQELIPYIRLYFQPKIGMQITNLLDYINLDNDYLKQNAIKLYLHLKHPTFMAINHTKLLKQHRSIQRKIIQLFLEHNTNIHCEPILLSKVVKFLYCKSSYNICYKHFQIKRNNYWIYLSYNTDSTSLDRYSGAMIR